MRCMITASLRATATRARLEPRRLAIAMPHARSLDGWRQRVIRSPECAQRGKKPLRPAPPRAPTRRSNSSGFDTTGCEPLSPAPGELILEIAVGKSMEPSIHNGDLLLIDTTDLTFQNFGIYVIDVRGERLVKRVQRNFDGSLILISDNGRYQPEPISAALAKEVRGVGRVIWRGGKV
jgi:hypothetical protein